MAERLQRKGLRHRVWAEKAPQLIKEHWYSSVDLGSPPAPSRAGRSLGKARRPYSDLLGCLPQLYNLLPQPGGRGRWAD